jgi:hypothetical protein
MSHLEEEEQETDLPAHLTLVEDDEPPATVCCACRGPAVVRFVENDFCGDCFHRVSADLFGPR